ncbi:MAG: Na+/H+ antiporter NhaA [Candidatus Thiocaldithrix dubininis]|uniref:Na(+)/H(+) antiporter NhaA n=1 Tax=Candidatus Thiocaldithrix dubininis TaxID=3080823 RepID=A0AA95KLK6_9GAMM|nr:MAG: Na+/H+ antiporter NhaA [Candidatus Thiocaldithrix dubininis]
MPRLTNRLSATFVSFFESERSSSLLLIGCTLLSVLLANSAMGNAYVHFWHQDVFGISLEHWVNDGLMAIFFLMIGLELERELYSGELSSVKKALLPAIAATGGVIVPALIHLFFNAGTNTQAGIAIPMATDIAFALGIIALLGSRIPASLKVFLVALAVIDDLIAVIIIAVFYTADLNLLYLAAALSTFAFLLFCNLKLRIMSLPLYLIGGVLMWVFMLKSGVHATIAGVLLAFAIPYSAKSEDSHSPSHKLENFLHKPVAFIILPIFALANTGVILSADWASQFLQTNSLGIMTGLILGKPLGIYLSSYLAVSHRVCQLPEGLNWNHIFGVGLVAGIGFTMSIFITNLAFPAQTDLINASKIAIFSASLIAGTFGYLWLARYSHSR